MPGRVDRVRLYTPQNRRNLVVYALQLLFISGQMFGCDGVLHSGKARDVCGVCGGDGSSCRVTSNSYGGGQAGGGKPN